MITAQARATTGPGQPFTPVSIERRDLGARDVLIEVAYAGICHTDVAHARSEWGPTLYPLVPGHEIAGFVSAVGAEVTRFAVGDRAGVGVMVDACRDCVPCLAGQEQHCTETFIRTYNWVGRDGRPTHGGYSERIVVDEDFAVRLPASLGLDVAAPLMCAGITVYSPLRKWGVSTGSRVAVLGLGGLGHVAAQMAKALGAHVTVLDLDDSKHDDAVNFGADAFVVSTSEQALRELESSIDVLLSTVPASFPLDPYLRTLAMDGVLVNIGVSSTPLSFDPFVLLNNRRVIAGTSIGGIRETQEMVNFCGEHGIGASVEIIGVDEIDNAYARLDRGDVRYRFVIDIATFSHGRTPTSVSDRHTT